MASSTTTTWSEYLFEMQGRVQAVYSSDHPWLAELNGYDSDSEKAGGRFTKDFDRNRTTFSGSQVRHTIDPYGMQAGGWVAQTGTWNVPVPPESEQVTLTLKRFVQPFSLTIDVERDSLNNSNAKAVARHVMKAREAVARNENIAFLGDGTGLLATVTGGTSPGLTLSVSGVNWNVMLPGLVIDVLTRSNGADPGAGLRRKIASVSRTTASTGTITLSTTQQASDGGSGNVTFSANEGFYISGSYGNVAQGLDQASATSGTFEGLAKTNEFWKGTDGRNGDIATLPLSDSMLDAAVIEGRRWGVGSWDFGLGDQGAINLYKQSKLALVHYKSDESKIKSGFKGILYDGADKPIPLIKEPAHTSGKVHLIRKSDFVLYGDEVGPAFLNDDGAMWRRFSRTLEKEADLLDRVEMGVVSCNSITFLANLSVA